MKAYEWFYTFITSPTVGFRWRASQGSLNVSSNFIKRKERRKGELISSLIHFLI